MTITQPGFYPFLTPAQYFDEPCPAPALTNSGVKTLLSSCPAKFAHEHPAIGQPAEERAETKATHLGSLVHRLALDKGDDYVVSPYDRYQSQEAKAWKADVEASGRVPVKQDVYDQAVEMAAVIREAIIIETQGHEYQTEVVFAWQRVVDGHPIWCRGMLDVWCPELNLALDVKTCESASDRAINRAFASGYAGQDCFYRSGLDAVTGQPGRAQFGFLFVEKNAPFLPRDRKSVV